MQTISLTAKQFNSIPDRERAVLVVISHALNEINVLAKWFVMTSRIDDEPRWKAHGQICQALVIGRTLIGKLHEAWEILRKGYFATPMAKDYLSSIDAEGAEAAGRLGRYFGRRNLVKSVRDSFAFHYSLDGASPVFEEDIPTTELIMYFGDSNGNTLYQFGEYVLGKAMLASIDPTNEHAAFGKLLDETSSVVADINTYGQRIITTLLIRFIGSDSLHVAAKEIEIGPLPDSTELKFPYFIKFNTPGQRSTDDA